jgi:hypothetical protein
MTLVVRAFPVRCERADVEAMAEEMRRRPDDTRRFYETFGVRREAWFFQTEGAQSYVIGVTDIGEPVEEAARAFATTDDEFARWFQQRVLELSGVDEREQPLGPPTTQVFDSTDGMFRPDAQLAVRMYPLTRGIEAVHEFAEELRKRSSDTRAFYETYEATESWFAQDTGESAYIIGVTSMRGDVEKNAARYAAADDPFASWFKQRVIDVTGIDPNRTPLGPPSEQIFEFNA